MNHQCFLQVLLEVDLSRSSCGFGHLTELIHSCFFLHLEAANWLICYWNWSCLRVLNLIVLLNSFEYFFSFVLMFWARCFIVQKFWANFDLALTLFYFSCFVRVFVILSSFSSSQEFLIETFRIVWIVQIAPNSFKIQLE